VTTTITTTTFLAPAALSPGCFCSTPSPTVIEQITHHTSLTPLTHLLLHSYQPLPPYLRGSKPPASLSISILEDEIIACFTHDSRVLEVLELFPKRYSSVDKSWRFPMALLGEVMMVWKALGGVVDSEMQEMATRRGLSRKRKQVPDPLSLFLSSPYLQASLLTERGEKTIVLDFPPVLEISILKSVDLLTSSTTFIARLSPVISNSIVSSTENPASRRDLQSSKGLQHLLEHLDIPSQHLNPLGDAMTTGSGDWFDVTLTGFCDYLLEDTSMGYGLLFQIYRPTEIFAERMRKTIAEVELERGRTRV
jgi:hypothetical protein